ncbi:hypothetical protein V5799_005929 [Amblyomma americanum]|uniref:Uncharacterized protein n=1 Tax=Amblyomma americanum TaxID=6943 RepID=A0AAQ4DXV0_AMBAM
MLNDLARTLVWNQGAPKKAQANSVFYTDGVAPPPGCLGPCRGPSSGLNAPAQPIYYEPPDAVGLVAAGSPLRASMAPGSSASTAADRCCGSSGSSSGSSSISTVPRPSTVVSPFRAKPASDTGPAPVPAYGSTTGAEVCDGNCGNIMCSVRACVDSPPSSEPSTLLPPGQTTELTAKTSAGLDVNDDDSGGGGGDVNADDAKKLEDGSASNKNGAGSADGSQQRTVPDVAHDSELKRAALAAAAAAAGAGDGDKPASGDVRATTLGAAVGSATASAASVTGAPSVESSANVRVVTMLGKLRGRTRKQSRNLIAVNVIVALVSGCADRGDSSLSPISTLDQCCQFRQPELNALTVALISALIYHFQHDLTSPARFPSVLYRNYHAFPSRRGYLPET